MEVGKFIKYEYGCYHFILNESEEFEFEEIAPIVLKEFDLKNDLKLKGKSFELTFSDRYEDDEDLIIYRIESLKLI